MEQSGNHSLKATAGFLRSAKEARHGQVQHALAPRTVSIAVTKPSLFGKRPPPRTPSMTVKNRASYRDKHGETLASRFSPPVELKSHSSNATQSRLHPVFVTLTQDVQDYPMKLPDATEALSAVCISRLGRSPASGVGSLPSTPLGAGSSCARQLEFMQGPSAASTEGEPPTSLQRDEHLTSMQMPPCLTVTAGCPTLQCTASSSAPVQATRPVTLDSSKAAQSSDLTQRLASDQISLSASTAQQTTSRQSHDALASVQSCSGPGASNTITGGCSHQNAVQAPSDVSIDHQKLSASDEADVALYILPSGGTRTEADARPGLLPTSVPRQPATTPPSLPGSPDPQVRTPALIGVITRSWASRGFCGASSDLAAATDDVPAPAAAPTLNGSPSMSEAAKAARPSARLVQTLLATSEKPVAHKGGRMPSAAVPVPGTALLPHGPVVLQPDSGLSKLVLLGSGHGRDAALAGVQCEPAQQDHCTALPHAAGGTEHSSRDDPPEADVGTRPPSADLALRVAACGSAGGCMAEVMDGTPTEAAVWYTETRSCQLAQYVSAGGWRGSAGASAAMYPERMPGAGAGQSVYDPLPEEPHCEEHPKHHVRLVLHGPAAPCATGGAVGGATASGGAGRAGGAGAGAGRGGQSVAHVREEVCMWRADVEDRAGRVAAAAARALLAPDAQELASVGPAAAVMPRVGDGGAGVRREAGVGATGGRGASRGGRGRCSRALTRGGKVRSWRSRDDCTEARLGYGEEEDASAHGRSESPDLRGLRVGAGAIGTAVQWEEGSDSGDCEGAVAERRGDEVGSAALLMTGKSCMRTQRRRRQARVRVAPRSGGSMSLSPDGHLARGVKHVGGTASVGICRAACSVQRADGRRLDEQDCLPDGCTDADIRAVAQALLANVPGGPTAASKRNAAAADSQSASPVHTMPRPHCKSLARICHGAAAAGSCSHHSEPTPLPTDPACDGARCAPQSSQQHAAGAVDDQSRSGAAWPPVRGSEAVTAMRRPQPGAAACPPRLPGPRHVGAPGVTESWVLATDAQVASVAHGRHGGTGAADSLWLQGSPALTPEDSFLALEGASDRGQHVLLAERSSASSLPLVSLSPQDSMVQVERRRRGRLRAPARGAQRTLSSEDRASVPQLAGMIQDALKESAGGHGVQSMHSVKGAPKMRPSKPDCDTEDNVSPAAPTARRGPAGRKRSPAPQAGPAPADGVSHPAQPPAHRPAVVADAGLPQDALCLVAKGPTPGRPQAPQPGQPVSNSAAEAAQREAQAAAAAAARPSQPGPTCSPGRDRGMPKGAAPGAEGGEAEYRGAAAHDAGQNGAAAATERGVACGRTRPAPSAPAPAAAPRTTASDRPLSQLTGPHGSPGGVAARPAADGAAARVPDQDGASAACSSNMHDGPCSYAWGSLRHSGVNAGHESASVSRRSRHRTPANAAWGQHADVLGSPAGDVIWRAPPGSDALQPLDSGGRVSVRALEGSRGKSTARADSRDGFHSLFQKFLDAQIGRAADERHMPEA